MQKNNFKLPISKIFTEDNANINKSDEQQAEGEGNSSEYSSDESSDEAEQAPKKQGQDEYETLEDLISKLNDEDHSEDQGIEDYKVGGYHPCHVGEVLSNRYVLIQKLGWGHFSTVWLARDFKYQNYVAIKIMKSSPHYLQASYDEVQILQKVATNAFHPEWIKSLQKYEKDKQKFDKDDCHVLNLLNSFLYKGPYGNHFCMVFQILGVNLWEVLKRYDMKGLPLNIVKEISRQVLMGLDYLNRICRVIHTDLKPENVLLCLTEAEIKKICEEGQLSNTQLYKDRLKLYREKYSLGPLSESQDHQIEEKQNQNYQLSEDMIFEQKQLNAIEAKIAQITNRLETHQLTKNLKKDLKKKIKKNEQKKEQILIRISNIEKILKEAQKLSNDEKKERKKSTKELFSAFDTKILFDKGKKLEPGFKVKIADLGNACWEHHHFATEIQTRQYRSPEVLTGSKYNLSTDMWSMACMIFQLLTGELLFNPRKDANQEFGKNDDHLAQMMQLLGRFPKKMVRRGVKANKYFTSQGALKRIPHLQNWTLKDVMIAKYRFKEEEAQQFMSFMSPMLIAYPEKRLHAHQLLHHRWLHEQAPEEYLLDHETHQKIKLQKYDLEEPREEVQQYESDKEDGSEEDNDKHDDEDDEDQFYGYEKVGDIRLIDRSYMDLGYIGYGDGIFLDRLDQGANWQFT